MICSESTNFYATLHYNKELVV